MAELTRNEEAVLVALYRLDDLGVLDRSELEYLTGLTAKEVAAAITKLEELEFITKVDANGIPTGGHKSH